MSFRLEFIEIPSRQPMPLVAPILHPDLCHIPKSVDPLPLPLDSDRSEFNLPIILVSSLSYTAVLAIAVQTYQINLLFNIDQVNVANDGFVAVAVIVPQSVGPCPLSQIRIKPVCLQSFYLATWRRKRWFAIIKVIYMHRKSMNNTDIQNISKYILHIFLKVSFL
jgi:hypothetical protein